MSVLFEPKAEPSHRRSHLMAVRRRSWRTVSRRLDVPPRLDDSVAAGRSAGTGTWHFQYLLRLVSFDVVVGLLAGLAGWAVHDEGGSQVYAWSIAPLALLWIGALVVAGAYDRRVLPVGSEQLRAVWRAAVSIVALVAVASYLVKFAPGRIYLGVVVLVLVVGGMAARWIVQGWLMRQRSRGHLMQRTVVVGRVDSAAALVRSLVSDSEQGLHPVAVCASGLDGHWQSGPQIEGVPVLATPDLAIDAVDLCDAEVVAVASHPDLAGPALRRLAWALEERGVELIVAPGLLDVAGPRLSIRPSRNLSLLHVERPGAVRLHVFLKAVVDRALATMLLLIASPLLIAVAVAVKLGDGGSIFFRQERVGVKGSTFQMFKFRTMVPQAEQRLEALATVSDGNGVLFKMQHDPRVTRVGRVLRRYSLDELPQLLNVLVGDMSLVGPRPPLPSEVAQYEPDAHRRLRVRPGMTGLWQVSGRSDLSWEESLRLDLHYVDNWSPVVDAQIMMRTAQAVVRGSGAY